ncbi:hypothetical protein ABBQ38_012081 [Trebouxia sp. C0009 RCD-2024]
MARKSASVFADFLYGAAPYQRAASTPSAPAPAVCRSGYSASLSNFEKQDNLAKALLHPRPVRTAAGKMDGGQADYTSPDRHHYLAPAASDAAPRWSEQKLLHRMAKEARSLATTSSTIRQKLFGTLQGFAAAEEQLNRAYPASAGSPARGLLLPGPPETARSSKRKDCMPLDHCANKKARHSSGSSMIPRELAFDAAEKAMQNNAIRSSEE